MVVKDKPYEDQELYNWSFIRIFKHDVLNEELVWHRDKNGRFIEILEGDGWEIQFDDKLPNKLQKGDRFFIPAKTYHRIKRGNTDLKIRVEEL